MTSFCSLPVPCVLLICSALSRSISSCLLLPTVIRQLHPVRRGPLDSTHCPYACGGLLASHNGHSIHYGRGWIAYLVHYHVLVIRSEIGLVIGHCSCGIIVAGLSALLVVRRTSLGLKPCSDAAMSEEMSPHSLICRMDSMDSVGSMSST